MSEKTTERPTQVRGLTVRQPWADAIAFHGKTIENRGRRSNYRGLVLIHAGQTRDEVEGAPEDLPDARGAVIATAQLAGCHICNGDCSPWADPGEWHWELADVTALSEPVPFRGALGLWTPPPELVQQVTGGGSHE